MTPVGIDVRNKTRYQHVALREDL